MEELLFLGTLRVEDKIINIEANMYGFTVGRGVEFVAVEEVTMPWYRQGSCVDGWRPVAYRIAVILLYQWCSDQCKPYRVLRKSQYSTLE